jgi:uncharacterized membrane protein
MESEAPNPENRPLQILAQASGSSSLRWFGTCGGCLLGSIQEMGGLIHMTLQLFAILILGLMCGSELSVAAFTHPALNRQSRDVHILVRSSFAALMGQVMPFWMTGSTLLNLLLLLPVAHLNRSAWQLAAMAFAIQVFAVVFSLAGPVPINNRIAQWTPDSVPDDWRAQEHRWDVYHWLRTSALVAAFVMLVLSVGVL